MEVGSALFPRKIGERTVQGRHGIEAASALGFCGDRAGLRQSGSDWHGREAEGTRERLSRGKGAERYERYT